MLPYEYCIGNEMGERFPTCIAGDILLKNLKMFTHMHCATLSLVGSQFILINSSIYTYMGPVI